LNLPFEVEYAKEDHWDEYMQHVKKAMADPKDINGMLLHEIEKFITLFCLACSGSGCDSQMYLPFYLSLYEFI
jgi:hypothetical protein